MKTVLRITHCDNRLECRLNGKMVWNKYFDYDNELKNETVDLTGLLVAPPETNVLSFRGFDVADGGISRSHFLYVVEQDGKEIYRKDATGITITNGGWFASYGKGGKDEHLAYEDTFIIPNWPVNVHA